MAQQGGGETDFDFSGLFELLNQMKRKFWTYDRTQERYRRQRGRLNNMYFQKLNPRGEQSAISKKVEKALQDVVGKDLQKKKAGLGRSQSQGDSTAPQYCADAGGCRYEDLNDAELNEILGTSGELGVEEMQKVLHNKMISSALDEMRKKPVRRAEEETDIRLQQKSAKKKSTIAASRDNAQHDSRSSLGLTQKDNRRPSSMHQSKNSKIQKIEKAQKEKVPTDWFKAHIRTSNKDGEKQATDQYIQKLKELEKMTDLFFSDQIEKVRYDQYQTYLEDEMLREKIAMMLLDKHEHLKKSSIREISKYIQMADKDLFVKLKNGHYTMDQIKARIAERKNNIKYTVLDDLKDVLDPDFFKDSSNKGFSKQLAEQLGITQIEQREAPIKSHFFYTGRDGGMKTRDYSYMPESLGKVDFNPQYTIPKFEKPIYEKKSVKDKVQKVQTVEEIKKQKEDIERNKKIKNMDKLKDTLTQQLAVHRQIELQQMPFDSSKQSFHDKMDMLMRMSQKRAKTTNADRKSIKSSKKGKCQSKQGDSQMGEFVSNFEQKKNEQRDRKFKLLFLKRLEHDGAKVIMTAQDREILKNYGKQPGNEDDEKILDNAIEIDYTENLSESERRKMIMLKQQDGLDDNEIKMRKLINDCKKTKAVTDFKKKYQKQEQKLKEQGTKYEPLFRTSKGVEIKLKTSAEDMFDQMDVQQLIQQFSRPSSTKQKDVDVDKLTGATEKFGTVVSHYSSPNQRSKGPIARSISSPNINNIQVTDTYGVNLLVPKSNQNSQELQKSGEGSLDRRDDMNFMISAEKVQKYQTQEDGHDNEEGKEYSIISQQQRLPRYIIDPQQDKIDQDQDQEIEDDAQPQRMKPKKINELIPEQSKAGKITEESATGSPQKLSALYMDSPLEKQGRNLMQEVQDNIGPGSFEGKTQFLHDTKKSGSSPDDVAEEFKGFTQSGRSQAHQLSILNQKTLQQTLQSDQTIKAQQQHIPSSLQTAQIEIKKMNVLQNQKSQGAMSSFKSMGVTHQGQSIRGSHRILEEQRLSEEFKSFANQFGIPLIEKPKTTMQQLDGNYEVMDGNTHTTHRIDSAGSKSIGASQRNQRNNMNYKTQPILQIQKSPGSNNTNKKIVGVTKYRRGEQEFAHSFYNKQPQTMKSSHNTASVTATQEGMVFSQGGKSRTLASSGFNAPNRRLIKSQHTKQRLRHRNELNIQQNTYQPADASQFISNQFEDDTQSEVMAGCQSLVPRSNEPKSYTYNRLKTALNMSRQRKMNFDKEIRQKNASKVQSQMHGRFGNNIHISSLQQSDEAIEDLKSLQLDSLHYDIVKNQCKIQGDYKSMAAVSRIQKKTNEDAIEKLQNKLMFNQQNKVRNRMTQLNEHVKIRGQVGHSNLLMSGTTTLPGNNTQTIWRNQSIKDIDTNAYPIEQIFLTTSNHKSHVAIGAARSSSGYATSKPLTSYSISKRVTAAEQRRQLLQHMTGLTSSHKLKNNIMNQLGQTEQNVGLNREMVQMLTEQHVSSGAGTLVKGQSNTTNMTPANLAINPDGLQLNQKLRTHQDLEYLRPTRMNNNMDGDVGSPAKDTDKTDNNPNNYSNASPLTPNIMYLEHNRKSGAGIDKRPMNFSQNSGQQQLAHTSTMNQTMKEKEQMIAQTEMDKLLLNNQV